MKDARGLKSIIDGCKSGNAESFSQLVDAYAKRCYGYFYRLTGNRALSDDLLSELFVRLVEKIGSYRGGSFEGWLFRIASNIFHDYLRAKQRQEKLLESQRMQIESEVKGPKSFDSEQIDELQTALNMLDSDLRMQEVVSEALGYCFFDHSRRSGLKGNCDVCQECERPRPARERDS